MSHGAVYLVTNLANGKRYVGQTTLPVKARWTAHVRSRFSAHCRLLARAIRKYGRDSFEVRTLASCGTSDGLNAAERLAIATFGTMAPAGYNLTTGGETAYRRSDETKRRISAAWPAERRAEWGRRHGARASEFLRSARTLGSAARRIPIAVVAADGSRREFGSCQEACRALGLKASAVSQCLNLKGRHHRHQGYAFERLTG